MSDLAIRDLERRWASGDASARGPLLAARSRLRPTCKNCLGPWDGDRRLLARAVEGDLPCGACCPQPMPEIEGHASGPFSLHGPWPRPWATDRSVLVAPVSARRGARLHVCEFRQVLHVLCSTSRYPLSTGFRWMRERDFAHDPGACDNCVHQVRCWFDEGRRQRVLNALLPPEPLPILAGRPIAAGEFLRLAPGLNVVNS